MACLNSALRIIKEKGKNEFTVNEVINDLKGGRYKSSSIRTHITSRCCVNAPEHFAKTYNYFERIGSGLYKISDRFLEGKIQEHKSATSTKKDKFNEIQDFDSFESRVRDYLSELWKVNLNKRLVKIGDLQKSFDLVSEDYDFVGDAKYYNLISAPSGMMATISEHVLFLHNMDAKNKFLVFGNDKRFPEKYLKKYGSLAKDVKFYFFDGEKLEKLN